MLDHQLSPSRCRCNTYCLSLPGTECSFGPRQALHKRQTPSPKSLTYRLYFMRLQNLHTCISAYLHTIQTLPPTVIYFRPTLISELIHSVCWKGRVLKLVFRILYLDVLSNMTTLAVDVPVHCRRVGLDKL